MESHTHHPLIMALSATLTALNIALDKIDWSVYDVAFLTPCMHALVIFSTLLTIALALMALIEKLKSLFKK